MRAPRLLFVLLIIMAALAIAHGLALHYYLYWRIFWFDDITHVLGGSSVGFFVAWLCTIRVIPIRLLFCAIAAFAVGVEWELFEYVSHFPISPFMSYPLDTAKDILMDVLGALAAGIIARRLV